MNSSEIPGAYLVGRRNPDECCICEKQEYGAWTINLSIMTNNPTAFGVVHICARCFATAKSLEELQVVFALKDAP